MIYVPMFKTRQEEMKIIKKMNYCFSNGIIPLVEILNEIHETRYEEDPETGEALRVPNRDGSRHMRVKCKPTDEHVITLKEIDETLSSKRAFIDYFRYTTDKYKKDLKLESLVLARKLSDNPQMYKEKLLGVCEYSNLIPVISIKDGFECSEEELEELIGLLKTKTDQVALRLTDEFIEKYSDLLVTNLGEQDYLMVDIEEQNPESKFMEYEEIEELDITAKVIILNSPHKVGTSNKDFPIQSYTDLIDNSLRNHVTDYNFHGYGDYLGLRDDLPRHIDRKIEACALVLIYDSERNQFFSYKHPDEKEGMGGYKKLIQLVKKDEIIFNPDGNCIAYKRINELPKSGNWGDWNNICATRYLCQMHSVMN